MWLQEKLEWNLQFKKHFKHIEYKDKIVGAYQSVLDTDPKKIIKWGWEEWDKMLWGIYWWKIYVVGASTGIGKSTFINQVCNNVSNQWFRVVKYSLEDRMEDIGKEEIFFAVNRLRFRQWKKFYEWIDFVNWELNGDEEFLECINKACDNLIKKENLIELDKTKSVSIDDLVRLMEEECARGTKLFAIDHLHYFEMDGKERHDLQIQNVMHRINEITRKYNIAVILVAHYRKNNDEIEPSLDEFKDWSAIKQVANIVIQITRDFDTNESTFHITKIRWPIKRSKLVSWFDMHLFEYSFTKSKESKDEYF